MIPAIRRNIIWFIEILFVNGQPIQHGSFCIHSIGNVNGALLGKLLWQLGGDGNVLWKQIYVVKSNITNDGWDIPTIQSRPSGIWKLVMSIFDGFISCIQYRVHGGSSLLD